MLVLARGAPLPARPHVLRPGRTDAPARHVLAMLFREAPAFAACNPNMEACDRSLSFDLPMLDWRRRLLTVDIGAEAV